jgi:hypothetical protein
LSSFTSSLPTSLSSFTSPLTPSFSSSSFLSSSSFEMCKKVVAIYDGIMELRLTLAEKREEKEKKWCV